MALVLDDVLDTLINKYGERRTSKIHGTEYFAVPKQRRKEIIRHLINTLKEDGRDKSYFSQDGVKRTIIEACFPEHAIDKWTPKMREGAKKTVLREIREVVVEFWPSDIKEANETLSVTATEEYNPSKHGVLGKDIDTSIAKDEPIPEVIINKEASRLLGFDDE